MKKPYQVYGVGSAIVDFEFQLTSHDWPNDLEKGTTLLIDDVFEQKLLHKLSHLTPAKTCGGSGANTLSVISGLGGKVFYSCNVANDLDGIFYHENLRTSLIPSNLDFRDKQAGSTGKSLILISSDDADRSLCTARNASGLLASSDLHTAIMKDAEFVFVEIFLATSPSAKNTAITALKMAKQLGCRTALTITTCKIPGFDKQHLYDVANVGVDLLFCNELEAKYLCQSDDLTDIVSQLKTCARQFVITRGALPTLVFDGVTLSEVPTYPVVPTNTTGAGDVFAGAFLYALSMGKSFFDAGKIANFAAGKVITLPGARLDNKALPEIIAML